VPAPMAAMTPLNRRHIRLLTLRETRSVDNLAVTVGASLTSVNRLRYYLKLPQVGLEKHIVGGKGQRYQGKPWSRNIDSNSEGK
jgi:hypothetical protein